MVTRYIEGGYGVPEMEEDADGDWVLYEDYDKLTDAIREIQLTPYEKRQFNEMVGYKFYDI